MTPASAPAPVPDLVRVRRADTGAILEVDPLTLKWWIPCDYSTASLAVMHSAPLKGDVPYLQISEKWCARVAVLPRIGDPDPSANSLRLRFAYFLSTPPAGRAEVGA
jgi:hypothetical protein